MNTAHGEEASGEAHSRLIDTLETGDVRAGRIASILPTGAVVDLGDGLEGFLSSANLTWDQVDNVSDVVAVGREVTLVVLNVDIARERVTLSLKDLHPDPLTEFARVNLGRTVVGRVTEVAPMGFFVQVATGMQGLIHSSQIDENFSIPKIGQEVSVCIDGVNISSRRISISLQL
ncbi:S1 RNA-binding domain-containing protein [Streptomyces sp. NPDC054787]